MTGDTCSVCQRYTYNTGRCEDCKINVCKHCALKDNKCIACFLPLQTQSLSPSSSPSFEPWSDYDSSHEFTSFVEKFEMIENSLKTELKKEKNTELHECIKATQKVGLTNLGNSCYINAAIQLFLHSPVLWSIITNHFELHAGWLAQIRKAYCKFAGINEWEQCDSNLFMTWMLDECTKDNQEWKIDWKIKIKCSQCEFVSYKSQLEHLWILYKSSRKEQQVHEDGHEFDYDMEACVENMHIQNIEKHCEECKGKNVLHKCMYTLASLPPNLFINLQNFTGTKLLIYQSIELSGYNDIFCDYELQGFIVHQGQQNYGHYIAYCLDDDGWYKYNDSTVKKVYDISKILHDQHQGKSIPLLWYERKDKAAEA
jgi:ubiquitin C-terminal hydrolase